MFILSNLVCYKIIESNNPVSIAKLEIISIVFVQQRKTKDEFPKSLILAEYAIH